MLPRAVVTLLSLEDQRARGWVCCLPCQTNFFNFVALETDCSNLWLSGFMDAQPITREELHPCGSNSLAPICTHVLETRIIEMSLFSKIIPWKLAL